LRKSEKEKKEVKTGQKVTRAAKRGWNSSKINFILIYEKWVCRPLAQHVFCLFI
jgi:hypothetical protein